MGQIFKACAYDIESLTCSVYNVDKFHANCYAHSGAVLAMHYLLRQRPYHIMWGGDYVVLDDYLANISRSEDLLGISTYEDYEDFANNNSDLIELSYHDKVKFIDNTHKLWNKIDVWDTAMEYFNWDETHSVLYKGYLVNHTQKLAVNLQDYYKQSVILIQSGEYTAIDLVPC